MRIRLKLDRLHRLLADSRLTQNGWAMKIGISRGHWSDLVNGRHPYPSPKTRQRLLEVSGLSLDELFEIEPGPTVWHHTDFRAALQDRYLIDRELGQGAMGSVYLARDVARGRTVAIKVLAPEAVGNLGPDVLLREISLISRLQHPNVVPLFDSGVAAGHPFYVMPWIRDGSLGDRIRRLTRMPASEAVQIAAGIGAALQYAHEQHVLHADVKPENVLLHGDHPYVMDFGIARILHAEASAWRARNELEISAGTPAYVSPEQATGQLDLDGRADLYSLACVVYEMLTGRPPFEGSTTDRVVARRFLAPPPPIRDYAPETPRGLERVVEQAMQVARERRQPDVETFAGQLEHGVDESGASLAKLSLGLTRAIGAARQRAGRPAAVALGGAFGGITQDARLAMRGLARSWRFAAAFVLPLALGVGAGATFYGVIDHVLYRPPPGVVAPDRIARFAVTVGGRDPFVLGRPSTSWLDYMALRRTATTLEEVAAFTTTSVSLGRGERARRIPVAFATASFFPLAGAAPQLGRFYTPEEDAETREVVSCVASDRLWRSELGGDPRALGRTLIVGNLRCVFVGVAPRGFHGLGFTPVDVWIPLRAGGESQYGNEALWNTDGSHWLRVVGRLKPGVTLAAADADATRAYQSVGGRRRDPQLTEQLAAESLLGSTRVSTPRIRLARWLVGGAAVLLALVLANLVNLLIARNLGRVREAGIRIALGGGWMRLFRYYMVEAGVLALLAGAAALLVVRWTGPVARAALFPGIEFADGPVTLRVIIVAVGATFVLGCGIALITTAHARRVDPVILLNSGGSRAGASRASRRARFALVGVQAALSLVLLVASAGFIRSFREAVGAQLGFNVHGLIQAEVPRTESDSAATVRYRALYARLHAVVREMPGVRSASLGYTGPWWNNRNERLAIPGRDSLPMVPGYGAPAFDMVTPDYLRTMQLRLVAGRWISERDEAGAAPVMVVNESLARLYWPGERNVIGRCIRVGTDSPACREIVGVVADHRFRGALDAPPIAAYFLPLAQAGEYGGVPKLFIRADGDAARLVPVIRRLVQGFEPGLPAALVQPVQAQLDPLLTSWRLGALAFTALGVVAAVIAGLGFYSVLAYVVAERRREFAIRGALGAQTSQIVTPVLRQGIAVAAAGTVAGVGVIWLAGRWLQPLLFQVELLDPVVVAGVLAGLLVVATLATAGPARAAARMNPIEALRSD